MAEAQKILPPAVHRLSPPRPRNPLDILEILLIIASYLWPKRDLFFYRNRDKNVFVQYFRVNKIFNIAFRTIFWSSLEIFALSGTRLRSEPVSLTAVKKNLHLIQNLALSRSVLLHYTTQFYPRLTRLHLAHQVRAPNSHWGTHLNNTLGNLIQSHSTTLQVLELEGLASREDGGPFWRIISELPFLNRLAVSDMRIDGTVAVDAFWQVMEKCPIQDFALSHVFFGPMTVLKDPQWPQERREQPYRLLSANFWRVTGEQGTLKHINRILHASPMLRSLTLTTGLGAFAFRLDRPTLPSPVSHLSSLSSSFVDNRLWRNLTKITMNGSNMDDYMIHEILAMLSSSPSVMSSSSSSSPGSLEEVYLPYTTVGSLTHRILLEQHRSTLSQLNFIGCDTVTSVMIHQFLCLCPRLISIQAEHLLASDLVVITGATETTVDHEVVVTTLDGMDHSSLSSSSLSSTLWSGQPWVCSELKVWKIQIMIDTDPVATTVSSSTDPRVAVIPEVKIETKSKIEIETHHCIFERLSRLTKLSTLDLSRGRQALSWMNQYDSGGGGDGAATATRRFNLRLRTDYGMDRLEPLKDLRELSSRTTGQQLAVKDQAWLLKTFPWLRGKEAIKVT
ncbi:hypothetical protein BGZ83_002490 [Gryganskiella cystojenkinii]|nr:hypothetical protein BGZ83_002490 [Gryganskiella cystojenkinii]